MASWEANKEIQIFQEYLRISTVHPNIDYTHCVEFLKQQAKDLHLPIQVYYPALQTKPVVVMTWVGQQPDLPSIILNSHMDVVPVFPEKWTHPPFGAEMDEEGRIFARGSQDMKCVGMQYLAAIRSIQAQKIQLKRTVHITFVPDEEIGGALGMREFVKSDDFKNLNCGFALDEGVASINDIYTIFYAERSIWQVHFKISGSAGHGSLLLKDTVGEKFHYILNRMMELRQRETERLENNKDLYIGDVTTINLTVVNGGVQSNVIPPSMEVVFDCRLSQDVDFEQFENQLKTWCEEAGGGIEIDFEQKEPKVPATKIDDTNPYWVAFKNITNKLGLKMVTQVFPGGTDSRYVRGIGIPAIGFSPMKNTPILLHDHDEFLKAETYLEGIEIYKNILPAIANC